MSVFFLSHLSNLGSPVNSPVAPVGISFLIKWDKITFCFLFILIWMSIVNHLEKSNNLGPIVIIAPCSGLPHPICSLIVNIVMIKKSTMMIVRSD